MISGAQTDLNQGTDQRPEEGLDQGTPDLQSQETGKWEDLNPEEYDPQLRETVVSLNKKAVSQFQNKVREYAEKGKLTENKMRELEVTLNSAKQKLKEWIDNPDAFLNYHKQIKPDYWANRQPQNPTEDKQALEILRKAGLMTKEDVEKLVSPFVTSLKEREAREQAESIKAAQKELSECELWCKQNSLPYSDKHARACFALIANGDAASMQEAYEQLFKPAIDTANQKDLLRKKESQLTKPTANIGTKNKDDSLDDIVRSVVKGS